MNLYKDLEIYLLKKIPSTNDISDSNVAVIKVMHGLHPNMNLTDVDTLTALKLNHGEESLNDPRYKEKAQEAIFNKSSSYRNQQEESRKKKKKKN